MSNFELFAKIGGDSSDLQRSLTRAQKAIGRTGSAFKKIAGIGVAAFKGLGLAAGGAVGSIAAITKSGLDFVDTQTKLARALNTTTDALRGVQIAASDAGLQDVDMSIVRLNRRLGAAEQGIGEYKRTLDALNLSARELQELPLDERLATLADAFKESGMTMQEAARHAQTLGFEQGNANTFFMQGGEVIRDTTKEVRSFGNAISDLEGKQVERAQDAMARLNEAFTGLRIELATQLAGAIESVSNKLLDMGKKAGGFRAVFRPIIEDSMLAVASFVDSLVGLRAEFLRVEIAFNKFFKHIDKIQKINDFISILLPTNLALKGFRAAMDMGADSTDDSSEAINKNREQLKELEEAQGAATKAVRKYIQANRERREMEAQQAAQIETPFFNLGQTFGDAFVPEYLKGFNTVAEAGSKTFNMVADVAVEATNKASESLTTMEQFGVQAARNMQTAFANFLIDPFKDGLKGMLQSFVKMLNQMVAELIAKKALTSFFSAFAGQSGIMGSIASGLGVTAPTGAPASHTGTLATGGPMMARQPYMVGEKGPELVVPSKSSYVVPNNKLGGGGGMSLSVNINAEDPGAEGRIRTMIERDMAPQIIEAATGNTLTRLQRPRFA